MECRLCKTNEATKTNSHLITWSLIKDVVNQPGFKARDYDVTFTLSNYDIPKLHTGRSVLPDHVQEVAGIDKEGIIEKQNPLSRDNIFCPACEDGISKIENEFIEKVYTKINRPIQTGLKTDLKSNKVLNLSDFETKLSYVFCYSLFFRTSIGQLIDFSLREKIEESIRRILVLALPRTKNELIQTINNLDISHFNYPILLFYLESENIKNVGENMIIQFPTDKPYFIWANKLIIQMYKRKQKKFFTTESFFELSQMFNLNEYLPHKPSNQISVCILSNEKRKQLGNNAIKYLSEMNLKNTTKIFSQACKKVLNRSPNEIEKNNFKYYYSRFSTGELLSDMEDPFTNAFKKTFNIQDK